LPCQLKYGNFGRMSFYRFLFLLWRKSRISATSLNPRSFAIWPGKTSIELAEEIFDINPRTFIVFATALSGHREEAFDVYAFDYLVKPFKMNRVRQTMERIKMALSGKIAGEPVPDPPSSDNAVNKMRKQFFRSGSRVVYLNPDDIIKEGRSLLVITCTCRLEINLPQRPCKSKF